MTGSSIETTLELWASSLRDVKRRMRSLFAQERTAASAGLFIDGLLGEASQDRMDARGGRGRSWSVAPAGTSGPRPLGCRRPARSGARLCNRASR